MKKFKEIILIDEYGVKARYSGSYPFSFLAKELEC